MKLAILVVYLVSTDNEKLLEIHLKQTEKNTKSLYQIYASVNFFTVKQIQNLRNHTNVKICNIPGYNGRMDRDRALYEHAHYLDHLVKYALEDDCTHFVVMHPDSFPIKNDWENILLGFLSENKQLVTLQYSPTSCLFFNRKYAKKYRPSFVPNIKTQQDKKFLKFLKERHLILESGIGYKYLAYVKGLSWHDLQRTNIGGIHYHFGSIFGDLIFHLGAAEHKDRSFPEQIEFNLIFNIKRAIGRFIPQVIKSRIRKYYYINPLSLKSKVRQRSFEDVRKLLYDDPDNFIKFLRTGTRKKLWKNND